MITYSSNYFSDSPYWLAFSGIFGYPHGDVSKGDAL